jgi:hypothetical protein
MADKEMTKRCLEIIRLINNHPEGLTVAEIHRKLQSRGDRIGSRQMARYPELLRSLGIELQERRTDRALKYWIKDFFQQPRSRMNDHEGVSLFLSLMASGLGERERFQKLLSSVIEPKLAKSLMGFFRFKEDAELGRGDLAVCETVFNKHLSFSVVHLKTGEKNHFLRPTAIEVSKAGVLVFFDSREIPSAPLQEVRRYL